jgi:hypothetical protein
MHPLLGRHYAVQYPNYPLLGRHYAVQYPNYPLLGRHYAVQYQITHYWGTMQCSIQIPTTGAALCSAVSKLPTTGAALCSAVSTAGAAIDDAVLKQPTIETQAGMIYEQISIRMGSDGTASQ